MIPGALTLGAFAVAPAPAPLLAAGVTPRSSGSANHLTGSVTGALTDYADLNACAWFMSGGWDLRNGRTMRRRGLSGAEDSNERHG